MSYSYVHREETFVRDLDEAIAAWFVFRDKRYHPVFDIRWRMAPEAFIDEFLYQRGWRMIPGSREWV